MLKEAQGRGNLVQKVLGPIRRIRFTQSTLRQASIREEKGPSLGKIQVKNPHQRSPYAVKFEDRSHEETERQQRCAQSKAWNLVENMYKLKDKDKTTFYSPSGVMGIASCINEPEEREFVVDSIASMHMVSKKDLNSAELETMGISRIPTTVMTANSEVLTREEATVCVKELDLFVTVMLLKKHPQFFLSGNSARIIWVYNGAAQALVLARQQLTQANTSVMPEECIRILESKVQQEETAVVSEEGPSAGPVSSRSRIGRGGDASAAEGPR